jgi:hypothetical protein
VLQWRQASDPAGPHPTGVQHVLLPLALTPLFGIFELLSAASLERIGVFRGLALVNLAKVTVSTTVTIFLAVHGFSYMSIAWGSLAGTLCGVICLNVLARRYVSLRLGLKDWRRITRFGLQSRKRQPPLPPAVALRFRQPGGQCRYRRQNALTTSGLEVSATSRATPLPQRYCVFATWPLALCRPGD